MSGAQLGGDAGSGLIAFQGEPGAFSHEACRRWFPDWTPAPCATFQAAFEAVRSGQCGLAMIPIENAIAGRVGDVHTLLPSSELKIVGERFLPIALQLMATPGARLGDIERVSSHPMALGQCRRFLNQIGARPEPVSDTAGAALDLSRRPDPARGVIASRIAAELYGLEILAENVEDEPWNTTRFLVMSAREGEPPAPGVACVTSFVFRVRNVPAALYKALGGFATNGVNLTRLESYMEGAAFSATLFHAEAEGRPEDQALERALEELGYFSSEVKILGVFPADPYRQGGSAQRPDT